MDGGDENMMRIGKRCYVGNLAWRTSWQDLKDEFRKCGTVVYANVVQDRDGRSRGWGIVEFETPEEAVAAVTEMNGVEIAGRNVIVREDREDRDLRDAGGPDDRPRDPPAGRGRGRGRMGGGRGRGPAGSQIVVHGLPFKFAWQELKDLFGEVADVEFADIVMDDGGRSKGFGTVRFRTAGDAQRAIDEFNGIEFEGRTLTVKVDRYAE
eukprot:TRINITY_DN38049_c0_g1_i2.p1 TRINITY_DN38049_c0_g1~~TRINITY_DN38049_c0_g1_i2.p1  ORF type:complete len:225 (-),score=51.18 TRINITY_DN38049_c0_g1_i2:761-1387(-)